MGTFYFYLIFNHVSGFRLVLSCRCSEHHSFPFLPLSYAVQLPLSLVPFCLPTASSLSISQPLAPQGEPAPWASPGSLLEMQQLWPHLRSIEWGSSVEQDPQVTPVHRKVISPAQQALLHLCACVGNIQEAFSMSSFCSGHWHEQRKHWMGQA